MKHFEFFPKIEYSDNQSINIMVRGKIRDAILEKSALYYKYELKDSDRPDILATKYYGNVHNTWAIFYANNIFDPRHDWPLNNHQFNDFIKSKYGNISKAQSELEEPHHYLLNGEYIIDKATYLNPAVEGTKTKVSNFDYEWKLNEEKRSINIIDVVYLRQITNELENLFKS
jgi:hypothetical protein